MVLPDIEKVQTIKLPNGSQKADFKPEHEAYLKKYASATNKALADKLGVSESTIKRKKRSMQLSKNRRVDGERKEQKKKDKQVKQKVEQLAPSVTEVKELQDNFMAIMDAPTGKDFNGIPLKQFDKFTISLLQNSDNPKMVADARAIYGNSKAEEQKQQEIEQRRKDGEVKRVEDRARSQYTNMKKEMQDMGCWFPTMKWDLMSWAQCKVDADDAWRKRKEYGDTVWKPQAGNGIMVEEKSIYYILYTEAKDRLEKASQKLSTGLAKYQRLSGRNDDGGNPFLKQLTERLNQIGED